MGIPNGGCSRREQTTEGVWTTMRDRKRGWGTRRRGLRRVPPRWARVGGEERRRQIDFAIVYFSGNYILSVKRAQALFISYLFLSWMRRGRHEVVEPTAMVLKYWMPVERGTRGKSEKLSQYYEDPRLANPFPHSTASLARLRGKKAACCE